VAAGLCCVKTMKHLGVSISRKLLPPSGPDVQGDRAWQWSLDKGLGFLKKACSMGVKSTIFFFFFFREVEVDRNKYPCLSSHLQIC